MAMRTMQHNSRANSKGRVHGVKHNDRNFDVSKADNIDAERTKDNVYLNYYNDSNMTFEEVELKFYNEFFGKMLERTNENYIKNGHPERVKTMEQFKQSKRYCPEETTMQIGKTEESIGSAKLVECYNDYNKRLHNWNVEHGRVFTTLNTALHVDEAVDHIQARRVWHYRNNSGEWRIGQERALECAGVQLPNPEKKESRRNNRKMTFDKMCREMWLDVLHEHGLTVEREALPNGRHNRDKEDMIRDKYQKMIDDTNELQQQLENLKNDVEKPLEAAERLKNIEAKKTIFGNVKMPISAYNELTDGINAAINLAQDKNTLLKDKEQLEIDNNRLQRQLERERNGKQAADRMRKAELERREKILKQREEYAEAMQQWSDKLYVSQWNDDGTRKSTIQFVGDCILEHIRRSSLQLTEEQEEKIKGFDFGREKTRER